jgi:multiple sugar transport system ATP-binding protein
VVEPTGSETLVVADLAGHSVVCAFRERVQAHPGEILRISPNLDAAHLFDEASGIRLS